MSIPALVSAISDTVVANLASAGYPALTDGAILLGRQHQSEQSSPPRIIFVPLGSTWGPRSPSSPSNVQAGGGYTNDQRAIAAQRPVLSEMQRFEVRCWGAADTGNVDDDIAFTQALYQAVILAVHLRAVGSCDLEHGQAGQWVQANIKNTQLSVSGQEFVFTLGIAVPVLDKLLLWAPTGTREQTTVTAKTPTGQTEIGAVIQ